MWSVTLSSIILSVPIEKATKIKFEGENSIVVDSEEGKRRISFTKEGKLSYSDVVADDTGTVKMKNELITVVAANKLEVWTQQKTAKSLNIDSDDMELHQE